MKKDIIIKKDTEIKFLLDNSKKDKNIDLNISFFKPKLSLKIYIVSICKSNQNHNVFVSVIHNKPFCESDIKMISFVKGKNACLNWTGNVIVESNAYSTTTYQYNKNYLLSKDAVVFARPNLETKTTANAGHKSIIIDYDSDIFFYLQSKGLSKSQIEKLLIKSYVDNF
jgi:Fe-S cluster assembly protein SufD